MLDEIKKTPYAHFLHSMIIAGEEGMGKSYFFAHVLNQISERHPGEGILVVRVSSRSPANILQFDDNLVLENSSNLEIVYNAYAQWSFGKKICLDISSYKIGDQRAIFLHLLNRIKRRLIPLDRKAPRGFIAIDDADQIFAVPEKRNCELQLGDTCFDFYRKSESESELEQLMFKDLKSREIAFIIVCRDPSIIHPFIVQQSLLRVFFRLRPSWVEKLQYIIQI